MPKQQRQMRPMEEQKSDPTFEVRQLKAAPGWYVRVLWRYGREEHIGGFASGRDAENWIKEKSLNWLRNRAGASRSV